MKAQRLSIKEQVFGASRERVAETATTRLSTPHGGVQIKRCAGLLTVNGEEVPLGQVESPDPVSIVVARRGLGGFVNGQSLEIRRRRFGLRLRNRSAELICGHLRWHSMMYSYRRFEVLSSDTHAVVLSSRAGYAGVAPDLSTEELVAAILFAYCGIIQGSSLINFISL